jgi:HK97 gp10 family phage protein
MSVRIRGIQGAVDSVGKYAKPEAMVASALAVAEMEKGVLVNEFLSGVPVGVRSGALRDSWHIWSFDTPVPGAVLYSDLYYARLLEYGTSTMQPRNFLKSAVAAARPKVKQTALDAWRAHLGG